MSGSGPLSVMMVTEAIAGGTGRHLRDVSIGLLAHGVRVHAVSSGFHRTDSARLVGSLRDAGIEVTEIDLYKQIRPIQDLRSVWQLSRIFDQVRPDLIHLHSSKAGAVGRIAAVLARRTPVLYTPHAYAFLDSSRPLRARIYRLAERFLGRVTDCVVAVSASEGRITVEHGLAPPQRVRVIPNGVEVPSDRSASAATGATLRLGFLGRLARAKEPMRLMELACSLVRRGIDFRLTLAGDGPLRGECERARDAWGLHHRVLLPGFTDAVDAFYRDCDVLLLTSTYEGLPYAALDAMAYALPVVGFRVPGLVDLVVAGETGLLAEPFDIEQMADLIAALAVDRERRLRLGRGGRDRVRSRFRLDQQIDGLLALYRELIAGPLRPEVRP